MIVVLDDRRPGAEVAAGSVVLVAPGSMCEAYAECDVMPTWA